MNKLFIIGLALLLGLASCQGNVHGEAAGRFETKSSSKTTVTINGKAAEERAAESKNSGATEGEFDIDMGDPIETDSVPNFLARIKCNNAISENRFEVIKSDILRETTDRNKILMLKRSLPRVCLSSAQVRDLAMLFTMDKYRLDFAKSFYGHTVDKMNYYKVKEAFIFDDSKEKLDQFVNEW
jgi:hypothetical protein